MMMFLHNNLLVLLNRPILITCKALKTCKSTHWILFFVLIMSNFSEIKPEYCKDESSTIEAPLMLKLIQSSRPNVFNSNVYNQKYGKILKFISFLPPENTTQLHILLKSSHLFMSDAHSSLCLLFKLFGSFMIFMLAFLFP